jgi:UPF0755 protein
MKTIIKIFLLALITVIIGIVLIKIHYTTTIEKSNSDNSEKVTVNIESGETLESIVNDLVDAGVLKENWKTYFEVYVRLNKLVPKIQAGVYDIPKNLNIKELASIILSSKDQSVWITIPEGLRKDEIVTIFENEFAKVNNTNFSSDEFLRLTTDSTFISTLGFPYQLTDLEGYLFPDKYSFTTTATTEDIIGTMLTNFKRKVGTEDTYQDIIIASMVEREGYNSDDRPMIADIINRRYAEGWLLQIDATLLYYKKDWKAVITQADKESDNPYNTYKKQGFPPTPISNPGLSSINSVRNPKANTYYYYIHDVNGNVHFARTLEEHNRNVQTYLR